MFPRLGKTNFKEKSRLFFPLLKGKNKLNLNNIENKKKKCVGLQ